MYKVGDKIPAVTGPACRCGEVNVTLQIERVASNGIYLVNVMTGWKQVFGLWTTGRDTWFTFDVPNEPSCL